jgi:hypothetical protein
MRRHNVAFATIAALFAIACGQGTPEMTAPGPGAAASRRSTVGMFLSRSGSLSLKEGDDLANACGADAKKSCSGLSGNGYSRQLTKCLRDHDKDLSAGCRDAIKKMRHDKDADDACAGACVCPQTCVADDDGDKGKDKDKGQGKGDSGGGGGGGSSKGKGSLRVATAATTSRDATHDDDHDDDDLSCVGACPAGMTSCDGRCVDVRSDPDNCGRCDNECEEYHGQVCSNGKCAAKCAPTLTNCTGACVDEKNDPNNCGACGLVCGCGQVCDGGFCVTPGACKQEGEACTGNECCGNLGLVCLAGVCGIPG